jgi:thiamine pyrophosphokinase
MQTVIFCNGNLQMSPINIYSIISKTNFIIAADGGANHLKKLNLTPHLIVGDMDSISEQSFIDDKTIEKTTYSTDKDQTDTELAILESFKRGCTHITLLGATGKRLDHTLANIELIKKYPGKITLIDNNTKLIAINNKQKLVLTGKKESIVSIFPASTNSPSIKTSGLKYNLDNKKLMFPTQGTSNTIQKNPAQISIDSGLLLVCTNINTKLEVKKTEILDDFR